MIEVELIYDQNCPNIEAARSHLLQAFTRTGIAPRWREWAVDRPETPAYAHGLGSPAILVDGTDVAGAGPLNTGPCCRVYAGDTGYGRTPTVRQIADALQRAALNGMKTEHHAHARISSFAMLPAAGLALLPKLICPACWPAYAGSLSALGIGFFNYTPYLLPATILCLVVAVAALFY